MLRIFLPVCSEGVIMEPLRIQAGLQGRLGCFETPLAVKLIHQFDGYKILWETDLNANMNPVELEQLRASVEAD